MPLFVPTVHSEMKKQISTILPYFILDNNCGAKGAVEGVMMFSALKFNCFDRASFSDQLCLIVVGQSPKHKTFLYYTLQQEMCSTLAQAIESCQSPWGFSWSL